MKSMKTIIFNEIRLRFFHLGKGEAGGVRIRASGVPGLVAHLLAAMLGRACVRALAGHPPLWGSGFTTGVLKRTGRSGPPQRRWIKPVRPRASQGMRIFLARLVQANEKSQARTINENMRLVRHARAWEQSRSKRDLAPTGEQAGTFSTSHPRGNNG